LLHAAIRASSGFRSAGWGVGLASNAAIRPSSGARFTGAAGAAAALEARAATWACSGPMSGTGPGTFFSSSSTRPWIALICSRTESIRATSSAAWRGRPGCFHR
jgi:hypothetical protein